MSSGPDQLVKQLSLVFCQVDSFCRVSMQGSSLRGNKIRTARTARTTTLTDTIFQAGTTLLACSQADAFPLHSHPLELEGPGACACGLLSHQPHQPNQPNQPGPPSQPTPALLATAEQLQAAGARFGAQFYFSRICIRLCILTFTPTFIIDTISNIFSGSVRPSNHTCRHTCTRTHRSCCRRHIQPPPGPPNISATCASSAPVIAVQVPHLDHFQTGIIRDSDQSRAVTTRTTAIITAITCTYSIRRLSPLAASTALGISPSSQRLRTQSLQLRTCHQPP